MRPKKIFFSINNPHPEIDTKTLILGYKSTFCHSENEEMNADSLKWTLIFAEGSLSYVLIYSALVYNNEGNEGKTLV